MAFGSIAALGQVDVATALTGPVLIVVPATIGGVIVAGFGGGLIKPAQDRRQDRLESGNDKQEVRSEPPTSPVGIGRVDS